MFKLTDNTGKTLVVNARVVGGFLRLMPHVEGKGFCEVVLDWYDGELRVIVDQDETGGKAPVVVPVNPL
jgi:hypothetical protein